MEIEYMGRVLAFVLGFTLAMVVVFIGKRE